VEDTLCELCGERPATAKISTPDGKKRVCQTCEPSVTAIFADPLRRHQFGALIDAANPSQASVFGVHWHTLKEEVVKILPPALCSGLPKSRSPALFYSDVVLAGSQVTVTFVFREDRLCAVSLSPLKAVLESEFSLCERFGKPEKTYPFVNSKNTVWVKGCLKIELEETPFKTVNVEFRCDSVPSDDIMRTEQESRVPHEEGYHRSLQETGIANVIREGRQKLIPYAAVYWLKRFCVISLQAIAFYLLSIFTLTLIERYLLEMNFQVFLFALFLFGFWSGYWLSNRKWWKNLDNLGSE
jgi:hypothetical protein